MKRIEPFLILNYYVLKICINMEKGVYVKCYKEENLKQIIFIEVHLLVAVMEEMSIQ